MNNQWSSRVDRVSGVSDKYFKNPESNDDYIN